VTFNSDGEITGYNEELSNTYKMELTVFECEVDGDGNQVDEECESGGFLPAQGTYQYDNDSDTFNTWDK
jgi:hypothetical protein